MTPGQWKAFEGSFEWQEIKKQILLVLGEVRDELELHNPDLDRATVHDMDMFNKGRASELRFLSDLPSVMAGIIEAEGEVTENKDREEDRNGTEKE